MLLNGFTFYQGPNEHTYFRNEIKAPVDQQRSYIIYISTVYHKKE